MSAKGKARAALLQMRAQIDEMLAETPPPTPAPPPIGEVLWMRISEFARAHHYSPKTISQWVKLGMPHIGAGKNCRINVRDAEKWIEGGGPERAAKESGMRAFRRATQ